MTLLDQPADIPALHAGIEREILWRLLTGDHEVTAVGFSVGYSSPSQFSREYRRMFGAAPSQAAVSQAAIASA